MNLSVSPDRKAGDGGHPAMILGKNNRVIVQGERRVRNVAFRDKRGRLRARKRVKGVPYEHDLREK